MIENIGPSRREQGLQEITEVPLSRVAADMFIAASNEFPSSVACQAMKIAIGIQEQDLNPHLLEVSVREDDAQERILRAANNAHAKRGKGPVEAEQASFITQSVFGLATRYAGIPPEDLTEFLEEYPETGVMPYHKEQVLQRNAGIRVRRARKY